MKATKSDPTIKVQVEMNEDARDPSGGCGLVQAVRIDPPVVVVTEKDTMITFHMDDGGGSRFTDFRYFNTTPHNEGWYVPRTGSPAPDSCRPPGIKVGSQFEDLTISRNGKELSVRDLNAGDALYLYLLEWVDSDGQHWVSDPKIKNQP